MKWLKRTLIGLVTLLLLLVIGVTIYLKTATYQPEKAVTELIKKNDSGNILETKTSWNISPKKTTKPLSIIFYPGGLVEEASYIPMALDLASEGFSVYIAKMPANLAVLNGNLAEKIIKENNIKDYVIGGHSLGGTMASRFANTHKSKELKGVYFFASYPDEKGELKTLNLPVFSIRGSKDKVLNAENFKEARNYLPENAVYESIEGGNHGNFGTYGKQKGDGTSSLSNDQQQTIAANRLINWINESVN